MKIAFIFILIPFSLGNCLVCPGGSRQCSDNSTCCQLPDGSYGCCPLFHATCCPDKIHCCPSGTKCEADECFQLISNLNISIATPDENYFMCRHDENFCPKNTTCCKNPETGENTCCLLPNAVCCSDGKSCCPISFKCDLKNKICKKEMPHSTVTNKVGINGELSYPQILSPYLNSILYDEKPNYVICPGLKYQCLEGETCCWIPGGIPKCCPAPDAVCCKDHLHCCPYGMKCDPSGKCYQIGKNITWLQTSVSKGPF